MWVRGERLRKDILVQYSDLQEEIKDLRRRIDKTKKQLENISTGGTVIDSVKGSRKDGTIGTIRIEGFPHAEYDRRRSKLYLYMAQLINSEEELSELTNGVEEYINSIEDSHIRRIVRYRVIDNMTWQKVADCMGGNNTEGSVKMAYKRFVDDVVTRVTN